MDDEENDEVGRAEREEDVKIVQRACAELMKRFDSVQITITKDHAEPGTISYSFGLGNYYARRDSVREWLIGEDEKSRISAT